MNCGEIILNINRDYSVLNEISKSTGQLYEAIKRYLAFSGTATGNRHEQLWVMQKCNQEIYENILDVLARREALNRVIEYEIKSNVCEEVSGFNGN